MKILVLGVFLFSFSSVAAPWKDLEREAFDRTLSIKKRWSALMKISEAPQKERARVLKKAYLSDEWLMKNAALISIKKHDEKKAIAWAESLLSDRAMIVRVAAAETLGELNAKKSEPLLWQALEHPRNYRKGTSLPSRRSIVKVLMSLSEDEKKWNELLKDKDEKIRELASIRIKNL